MIILPDCDDRSIGFGNQSKCSVSPEKLDETVPTPRAEGDGTRLSIRRNINNGCDDISTVCNYGLGVGEQLLKHRKRGRSPPFSLLDGQLVGSTVPFLHDMAYREPVDPIWVEGHSRGASVLLAGHWDDQMACEGL